MTFDARIQEALQKVKQHAALDKTVWIPENPGDTIAGQVIEIGSMVVKILGEVPTTLLKCDDGEYRRLSWGGATLRPAWDRFRPQIADFVVAAYHGKRSPKNDAFGDYDDIEVVVLDENLEKKVSILDELGVNAATGEIEKRRAANEAEKAQWAAEGFGGYDKPENDTENDAKAEKATSAKAKS